MSCNGGEGPSIEIGYRWSLLLSADADGDPLFPEGVQLKAHVKKRPSDLSPIFEITTLDGGFVRTDDFNVEMIISEDNSALLEPGHVFIDITRTDISPHGRFDFRFEVPVLFPITRRV